MTIHAKIKKPLSYVQRAANAAERERSRLEKWTDPVNAAIRKVRAALVYQDEAYKAAKLEFEQTHKPVVCLYTGATIHPHRAAAIAALAGKLGWSTDPREAVEAFKTVEELFAEHGAKATADLAAAQEELKQAEADRNAAAGLED